MVWWLSQSLTHTPTQTPKTNPKIFFKLQKVKKSLKILADFSKFWQKFKVFQNPSKFNSWLEIKKRDLFNIGQIWPTLGQLWTKLVPILDQFWTNIDCLKSTSGHHLFWLTGSEIWVEKVYGGKSFKSKSQFSSNARTFEVEAAIEVAT